MSIVWPGAIGAFGVKVTTLLVLVKLPATLAVSPLICRSAPARLLSVSTTLSAGASPVLAMLIW